MLVQFLDAANLERKRRCRGDAGRMWKRCSRESASVNTTEDNNKLTRASIVVAMLGNYNSQCQNPVQICLITVAMMLEEGCAVQNRVPKSIGVRKGVEDFLCKGNN
jgi:hypothetical protein